MPELFSLISKLERHPLNCRAISLEDRGQNQMAGEAKVVRRADNIVFARVAIDRFA
jgi:hypothetical protein